MSWKAGDIAIVNGCINYPETNGMECTVTSCEFLIGNEPYVSIDGLPGHQNAMIMVLIKKPYNGNELCEWEDMKDIFIPRELVATT